MSCIYEVILNPFAGMRVDLAIVDAIAIAAKLDREVILVFNDTRVTITGQTEPGAALSAWMTQRRELENKS